MNHPRSIFNTNVLTNTAQDVGPLPSGFWVAGISLSGGAAAQVVIFQNTAGTELFRVKVPILTPVIVPIGFWVSAGLRVITAGAAGDVTATVFFNQP